MDPDLDHGIAQAVEDTEHEVFAYAADEPEPEDLEPEPSSDRAEDGPRSLEMVDGLDGMPLSDAEQWQRTLYGDGQPGGDRPLQHAAEISAALAESREVQALRAENAQLHQVKDPVMRANEEATREQQRQWLIDQSLSNPDQVLDVMNYMHAQRVELDTGRVEKSLADAHQKYGDEFGEAYKKLVSQPHNDPFTQSVVRRIWQDKNPGETLMTMARGELPGSRVSASGRPPPFMGGTRSADRSLEDQPGWDTRSNDLGSDADTWAFATRE